VSVWVGGWVGVGAPACGNVMKLQISVCMCVCWGTCMRRRNDAADQSECVCVGAPACGDVMKLQISVCVCVCWGTCMRRRNEAADQSEWEFEEKSC